MSTILVTGATGFIAGQVIADLLNHGHKVLGTVRQLSKASKLQEAFPEAHKSGKLTFATLSDVRSQDELKAIFASHPEIAVVMHTASPFFYNSEDVVKDLLEPALEGTRSVLQVTQDAGHNVHKVVLTSSVASMLDPFRNKDPSYVATEATWNPVTWDQAAESNNAELAYVASKTFAEQEAWKFVESTKPRFSLTTVNPAAVFGPHATKIDPKALNTSSDVINSLALDTKPGDTPGDFAFLWVDVRNVARAHTLAIDSKLDDKRLLLCNGKFAAQDLVDILNKNFSDIRGTIAEGTPGNGPRVAAQYFNYDNSNTRQLLDLQWIGLEQSIVDFTKQYEAAKSESRAD
ncbi:YALI0B08052p [Yarrowia lipolytica CLIB122]|uniref:YALI0B08052p n=2 Tax=Yarrowia lipolytica TaxID=4952 RepID=Q6CFD7_YARLI|nr:YALI0B08052p [Yarrowia lipolytica CLIB122]AOW01386.1 hypothetical protein YALI1_B10525g [Yarrowia lipolytica]KAB8281801.1 hypothetical protein BKA91DRAFT_114891 [Yarrowia lipolytica]KAE8171572.1 hypothetical protein BKA90DRAFT_113671 [Yarrowia lipolytica]KAJ8052226.1 hypothetical protein LXG23DRAFT_38288 [Yarrowia lipolytica]RMJ00962.1 hypothetical protein BD777DRAFT_132822 [Yarrowia lipolytica]|eukprot:XP_500625.1 YALI0B08052p [Yarrowia lipolytica CLIB122]